MRLSVVLGILALLNLLLAFLIQGWVLVVAGAGVAADAFVASLLLPQFLFAVVSSQIPAVLVPLFAGTAWEEMRGLAWSALFLTAVSFVAGAALFMATAGHWVPVLVPGLEPEARNLAVRLSRIQVLGIPLLALHRTLDAVCHARQKFVRVEAADLVSNAAAFAALVYCLPRYGIQAAAWAMVARPAAATLLLFPTAGTPRRPSFRDPVLGTALRRLRPILWGSLYIKAGPLLDRFLASWTGSGALALLHFAERLYGAAFDVFRRSIVGPSLPRMSEHAKNGNWPAYRSACLRRLALVALASAFSYAAVAAAGLPLLKLLVGHGGLTRDNVTLFWCILLLMGGYLVGGALNYFLAQAFYAKGETALPVKIGMIGFSMGIPLKVAGVMAWGVHGLAAATGVQQLLNLVLFLAAWRRSLARAASPPVAGGLAP